MRRQHREATAADIGLGTTSRRRKHTIEACVDNTGKLRPQASVLVPRPCTCNAQRAAPRATACTKRSSTCVAPRASAWAPRSSTATHNERRRRKRPGATMKYLRCTTSAAAKNGLSATTKYLVNETRARVTEQQLGQGPHTQNLGTSHGPFMCGARACSLCSLHQYLQ